METTHQTEQLENCINLVNSILEKKKQLSQLVAYKEGNHWIVSIISGDAPRTRRLTEDEILGYMTGMADLVETLI